MLTNRRAGRLYGPALVLSAALVLTACTSGTSTGPTPEPADATVSASDPSGESATAPSTQTSGGSEAPPSTSPTAVPIGPAAPGAVDKAPEPIQVRYPAINAELPVEPRGVADDGQMDLPDDAGQAAWYQFGMTPADDAGTTVIAAHAGSEETPFGPFYGLLEAQPSDEVTVVDESGEEHRYQVTETQQLGKDGLDFTPYFQRSGAHQLVLITCGGQWVPEQGSYTDNVIVVAEPID